MNSTDLTFHHCENHPQQSDSTKDQNEYAYAE